MDDKPDFLTLSSETVTAPVSTPAAETAPESSPTVTFRGNGYDLTAVVAVTIGGVMVLTCGTCNLGLYVLPFVPVILGIIGLVTAKDSVNPEEPGYYRGLVWGQARLSWG